MNGRPVLAALFTGYVKKWAESVEAGKADEARWYARELAAFGRGISSDPAFLRAYKRAAKEACQTGPDEALLALSVFLTSLTDLFAATPTGGGGAADGAAHRRGLDGSS